MNSVGIQACGLHSRWVWGLGAERLCSSGDRPTDLECILFFPELGAVSPFGPEKTRRGVAYAGS